MVHSNTTGLHICTIIRDNSHGSIHARKVKVLNGRFCQLSLC